jgi:NAD-dependent SIR2 family protein deacetylase
MNRFFTRWFLIAIISISFCNANEPKIDFFSNPQVISSNDILEQLDSNSLDMSWQFGENNFFHFTTKNNEVYFEILFDRIPSSYDELTKSVFIEKASHIDNREKKHYIFSYEWKKNEQPVINLPRENEKNRCANTSSYLVDKRRIFKQSAPQFIGEDEILWIIANKRILFYTGAGLSVASKVPSMTQLNNLLGLKNGEEFVLSLQNAVLHPESFSERILAFHDACFFSPPTEAHRALSKLALFINTKIVTENLDRLHEYSGIIPYRIDAEELRQMGGSQLRNIDYVICIGLSYDDRGFLGWYKNNNLNGKIISVDLGHPTYLGDEDFIIHTDLQDLIPSLANQIIDNK